MDVTLYSAKEVGAKLGISQVLVRRYARQGRLRAVRSHPYVFTADAIQEFMERPRRVGNPMFGRRPAESHPVGHSTN
jgi:predicted site-specific integrase-resolvase